MVKLKVKVLGIEAGDKPIAVLHEEDAADLGVSVLGRVTLKDGGAEMTAVVNITRSAVQKGTIGVFERIATVMNITNGAELDVNPAQYPTSVNYIRSKMRNRPLAYEECLEIVKDTVAGRLSEIELTAFVTALNSFGMSMEESVSMARAMVETGRKLEFNAPYVVDKHSIGGVPGDKTTLLVVPIVAACGLTIPKTSSRSITSAAGTADRAEVLMPVTLSADEMKAVVNKTGGCIVWGGALELAPADDIFIRIEHPLSIDPLMMPSIMSKKKAVGSEYLIIDIPCGRGTKLKTIGDADLLAKDMIEMAGRLGIKAECAITYGEQPIGHTIGPALEAREALEIIMRKRAVPDALDKAKHIASMLLNMVGKDGPKLVEDALKSGKAEEKLRQIIFEQGGDHEVQPSDIEIGKYGLDIHADRKGVVLWANNQALASVARAAGSPSDKGAGIYLYVLDQDEAMAIGDRMEMLVHAVRENPLYKKSFILER
ncbi:MAG: AMP phosphorylase [Candidatus Aenigmarchaeota archaeon]|nr:AMP phosphorylase [Candidatus Aenigmarchaeota archaeon]